MAEQQPDIESPEERIKKLLFTMGADTVGISWSEEQECWEALVMKENQTLCQGRGTTRLEAIQNARQAMRVRSGM